MKKIIDENGRLFGLVSIIDVLVVAVAAVLVFALYRKDNTMPIASVADPMDNITYQVAITNMPQGRWESLRVGDTLYDKETGYPVGTIEAIQDEPCVISMLKADGTYVMAPIKDRLNVTLTVKAQALVDARQHYYINRNTIVAAGWGMELYTVTSLFNGTVMGIETT